MLTRLLLACFWLGLGVSTAFAPRSLLLVLVEQLGVTQALAGVLTWGVIAVELALGLGLILSVSLRALRPVGLISLVLSVVFLGLVLLVDDLRACNCFGIIEARPFLTKLAILGGLVYLSALVAWPKPPKLPAGRTAGFTEVIRRGSGPGSDLATPPGPGTIARSPEATSTPRGAS